MTAFTAAIMPLPPSGFITASSLPTMTPWSSFDQGTVLLRPWRGPPVKIWNGATWVLAPPS